jgi:hypothetical protein
MHLRVTPRSDERNGKFYGSNNIFATKYFKLM